MAIALDSGFGSQKMPADPAVANIQEISDQIFGPYLLPFWALSFVLLAAVVGAIVLARRD
jgi:NADH-quinone oxidoreductase subunit J